ncbi:MAG: hypothetical protein JWO58_2159 [Chitinophagaceae bacterium]|nr:hypothetical protein [Chitinophagaceae bacterium]
MKNILLLVLVSSMLLACGGSKNGLHSHKAKRPPCGK